MLLYHYIEMLFLSHQSMTFYGTPFYAIVPINCNALVTRPIYDTLRYSFLCYCIIVMKCFFLSHQSMSVYSTPFYAIAPLYCNSFCYSTNLQHTTVFHFMLLYNSIAMPFVTGIRICFILKL